MRWVAVALLVLTAPMTILALPMALPMAILSLGDRHGGIDGFGAVWWWAMILASVVWLYVLSRVVRVFRSAQQRQGASLPRET